MLLKKYILHANNLYKQRFYGCILSYLKIMDHGPVLNPTRLRPLGSNKSITLKRCHIHHLTRINQSYKIGFTNPDSLLQIELAQQTNTKELKEKGSYNVSNVTPQHITCP